MVTKPVLIIFFISLLFIPSLTSGTRAWKLSHVSETKEKYVKQWRVVKKKHVDPPPPPHEVRAPKILVHPPPPPHQARVCYNCKALEFIIHAFNCLISLYLICLNIMDI